METVLIRGQPPPEKIAQAGGVARFLPASPASAQRRFVPALVEPRATETLLYPLSELIQLLVIPLFVSFSRNSRPIAKARCSALA
jgi:hypothetical protein